MLGFGWRGLRKRRGRGRGFGGREESFIVLILILCWVAVLGEGSAAVGEYAVFFCGGSVRFLWEGWGGGFGRVKVRGRKTYTCFS